MRQSFALGLFATLIGGSSAFAELVYFARGGQVQLPATIDGPTVRLDTPIGPKVFPREDFLGIVPGHRPAEECSSRREAALKDGRVEARFASAWWALENGFTTEAVAQFRDLRPLASTHGPTRRAISQLDALALPCPDPDLEPLRQRLKSLRFRELRGPHVVLIHQVSETEALDRLDLLERVVQTFSLTLGSQGIELPAPRHRLVSVYFADRRDYAQFLRSVEAEPFVDTQGYYHPTLAAVFAFDGRSSEEQKTARRAIANRSRNGVPETELARQSLLLDLDWRTNDLGIAAHETVHQLTIATGLAPRFDDFPLWLLEGFATQFEVVRGGRWAGVGRAHDLRLPDWRSIRPLPRLAPLLRDSGFGKGYRRDVYAESWGLVYFLRKTRPREFVTFLDLLRTPSIEGSTSPDRSFEAFRAAFGDDLGAIELDWHRYLADLKTPLEAGRLDDSVLPAFAGSSKPKRQLVGTGPAH